jgi:hypothetical protein
MYVVFSGSNGIETPLTFVEVMQSWRKGEVLVIRVIVSFGDLKLFICGVHVQS